MVLSPQAMLGWPHADAEELGGEAQAWPGLSQEERGMGSPGSRNRSITVHLCRKRRRGRRLAKGGEEEEEEELEAGEGLPG